MYENRAVVIPAYKPGEAFIRLVSSLSAEEAHIIIVDDGSGSDFSAVFDSVKACPAVHILRNAVNMGKGRALKYAFNYILNELPDTEYVITADADGQHTPAAIHRLEAAFSGGREIILGSRSFHAGRDGKKVPLRSRMGNGITTAVFRFLCDIPISDTQTGLRLIPVSVLKGLLTVGGERYEYETNCLLWCREHDVAFREIEIETIYEDKNKSSHFHPFTDSLKIYRVIFSYSFASLASAAVDYFLFFLCSALGCSILAATYLARAGSSLLNFTVNRNLVFRAEGSCGIQLAGYLLLVLFSGTISGISVSFLHHTAGWNLLAAKIGVELCLYFFNYFMQRMFIFKKEK